MRCEQCGKKIERRRFCADRCKWTWHNHNRTLPPNTFYRCEVCKRDVAKYLTPTEQQRPHVVNRFCSRTCAGVWRRGANHPMWRGGEPVDSDGYVYAMCPGHKHANAHGYVFKHRLVMESRLGRLLLKGEVVHHRVGCIPDLSAMRQKHCVSGNWRTGGGVSRRNGYSTRRWSTLIFCEKPVTWLPNAIMKAPSS